MIDSSVIATPLTLHAPSGIIAGEEIRHALCHKLLFVVRANGIEIKCDKCGALVLYSWRQIILMMLAADCAKGEAC